MSVLGHCLTKNAVISARLFHLSARLSIDPKTVEEVRIPVPWGHIAGKWWGSKDIQPILAMHGWLDNSGSWDPFTQELPSQYSLLAIDIPGNGLSTHFPQLQNYSYCYSGTLIHYIKDYFNFEPLTLLGHSGGSGMCFTYSCLFPEFVKSYFGIDYLCYAYGNELKRVESISKTIDQQLIVSLRDKKKSKGYDYEDALKAWVDGSHGSLNIKSANILMKRGASFIEKGKVNFSRDARLKLSDLVSLNVAQVNKLAENIRCHVCLIKSTDSRLFQLGIKHVPDILNIIKKNAKSYYFHELKGNHHLHMDIPDKIVELFVDFQKKVNT